MIAKTTNTNLSLESFRSSLPDGAKQLIWDEFFASRNRGQTLLVHSPWLAPGGRFWVIAVESKIMNAIVGCAIVKSAAINGRCFGMVGYVCVAHEFRCQGIASQIVTRAIDIGAAEGWPALYLWTTKAAVYEANGFERDLDELYAVSLARRTVDRASDVETRQQLSDRLDTGLPAFANRGYRLIAPQASVSVAVGNSIHSVVGWVGDDKRVATLIDTISAPKIAVNVSAGDPLVAILESGNRAFAFHEASVRMVYRYKSLQQYGSLSIQFMDRI